MPVTFSFALRIGGCAQVHILANWGGPRQRDRKRNHFLNPKRGPNHQQKTGCASAGVATLAFAFPFEGMAHWSKLNQKVLPSSAPYCLASARRSVTKTCLAICKGPAAIAKFPNTGRCGGVSHCGVRGVKHFGNHNRNGAESGLGRFKITMLFNQSRVDSGQSGHNH